MSSAENVYLNGRIVPAREACVSPLDRGFLYGDGFFETTRIVAGRPLLLSRHLERLAASCAWAGFGRPLETVALADGVKALIDANGVLEGYLRITVSRGLHKGLAELRTDSPTVLVQAHPMEFAAPAPAGLTADA